MYTYDVRKLIKRKTEIGDINNLISSFPVAAILGPRQCGKTVLANQVAFDHYFDLENPRDSVGLENPQLALESLEGLIVIDEIQRAPDIFQLIRYLVDSNSTQRNIRDELSSSLLEESERSFDQRLIDPKRQAQAIGSADIVVGIPFYNEATNITSVIQTIRAGLEEFYLGQKAIIVAVGSPVGGECLRVVQEIPESESIKHIAFLLDDERINGKGWAIRAAMEIAQILNADLVIIEADLTTIERDGDIDGLAPDWIYLLLEPIKREKMDLVVSHFNGHYLKSLISTHLVNPLLTTIYNCPIHDALGGQWGISHRLLHIYLQDSFSQQGAHVGSYGIDIWLATKAASVEARICESNLGLKMPGTSGKIKLLLQSCR